MEKGLRLTTEEVKAVIDGRKSMKRMIIKSHGNTPKFYDRDKYYKLVNGLNNKLGLFAGFYKDSDVFTYEGKEMIDAIYFKSPYQVGDMLYVRETWCKLSKLDINDQVIEGTENYYYRADGYNPTPFNHFPDADGFSGKDCPTWKPSVYMPKEAARIWLKVTDVRVERLQDIRGSDVINEGVCDAYEKYENLIPKFKAFWDSIYAPKGYVYIGGNADCWDANPNVFVSSFERINKPCGQ